MFLENAVFPSVNVVRIGSTGGPGLQADVTELDSGQRYTNDRRGRPLWRYDIASEVSSEDSNLRQLVEFFLSVQTSGFRLLDDLDHSTSETWDSDVAVSPVDMYIGTGSGAGTTFQLKKNYQAPGGLEYTRLITKPIAGTVRVALNGVEQLSGWSVDTSSGIVTFTVAPGVGVEVRAGFQFHVPVAFSQTTLRSLTTVWSSFQDGVIQSMEMTEILNGLFSPPNNHAGGAKSYPGMTASVSFTLVSGRVQSFDPVVPGLIATLPNLAYAPKGGPVFYVLNVNATNSITVNGLSGAAVTTLAPGEKRTIVVGVDSVGNKVWHPI